MQQIYSRTHMPKCNFNKVAMQLYWNHISVWEFSSKFAAYFQNILEHIWVAASKKPDTKISQISNKYIETANVFIKFENLLRLYQKSI